MSDQQHPDPCRTGGQAQVTLALRAADIVGVWDGDLVAGMVYGDANFARIYGVDAGVATQGVPLGSYFKFPMTCPPFAPPWKNSTPARPTTPMNIASCSPTARSTGY
jgi:hypothetical protein